MIMKAIQAVLIVLLSLHLFSCSDDKDDSRFSETSLKQTQWTGTLYKSYTSYGESYNYTYKVGVIFYTETEGKTTLTPETSPEKYYESDFKYSIKEKMLNITNGGDLEGYWLLIESDQGKMILEQGTGGENANKKILTLSRVH